MKKKYGQGQLWKHVSFPMSREGEVLKNEYGMMESPYKCFMDRKEDHLCCC